jgi:hypothetical protein
MAPSCPYFLEETAGKKASLARRLRLGTKFIKILNKSQGFFRVHSSYRRITVGIKHHLAAFRENKLRGLNMVSSLFPPCTDRVTISASHSVGKRITQSSGNIGEFLFRIDRTGYYRYSLFFERSTAFFKASQ